MSDVNRSQIIIKCFLLAAIAVVVALLIWGCGKENDIPLPTNSELDSEEYVLQSPSLNNSKFPLFDKRHKNNIKVYDYTLEVIGSEGGSLTLNYDDKVIVRQNITNDALMNPLLISMEILSDGYSWIYLHFQPDGIVFQKPVELRVYLESIKKLQEEDLVLYYYDDKRKEWLQETSGIFSSNSQGAVFQLHHYSYYYYSRR